jgi:hypothetical protein
VTRDIIPVSESEILMMLSIFVTHEIPTAAAAIMLVQLLSPLLLTVLVSPLLLPLLLTVLVPSLLLPLLLLLLPLSCRIWQNVIMPRKFRL